MLPALKPPIHTTLTKQKDTTVCHFISSLSLDPQHHRVFFSCPPLICGLPGSRARSHRACPCFTCIFCDFLSITVRVFCDFLSIRSLLRLLINQESSATSYQSVPSATYQSASSTTSYQSVPCPPQGQPYSYPPRWFVTCRGRLYLAFEDRSWGFSEVRSPIPSSDLPSYSLLQEGFRGGKV